MRWIIAWLVASTMSITAFAEEHVGEAPDKVIPEPIHVTTTGSVKIDGKRIDYDVVAGQLLMKDDEGKPIALFGYTAYTQKGADRRDRPVLFAYNGGPGSASMWLHMGILGPQRTAVTDTQFNTKGPFKRVNNEYSILDKADLVMIDPVGTGFSRPVGDAKGDDFWGVDDDIRSVSDFIARWVTEYGRWESPKFLLGESYGGIRSGGVSLDLLSRHSIALNGVILVSPYMDFVGGNAGLRMDQPYINYFTTYAATAWYHGVSEYRPDDLQTFLRAAEAFVDEEYAPLLMLGNRATAEARASVLAGMQKFTGISADFWDRANLRIDESEFAKELLREQRKTVGRIDARFVGEGIDHIKDSFSYDPFFPAVGPAFVATFNDYYREVIGVKTDMRYVTSAGLWRSWEQKHQTPGSNGDAPVPNTGVDLNYAMIQNPHMRVLVQQGYYDLATPYGATNYFMDQMELPESLQGNLVARYYEAGHMMYLHPASMEKFKADLAAFITP
ncbi:MAG: carboxypeptidase [Halieaceae bacterium]|jgi:carboxypeptidase C (cathepsin A)|nr:carboxypeptidase [Halieaceae bacterium]